MGADDRVLVAASGGLVGLDATGTPHPVPFEAFPSSPTRWSISTSMTSASYSVIGVSAGKRSSETSAPSSKVLGWSGPATQSVQTP